LTLLQPAEARDPTCPRVFVPRPALSEMVEDAFRPIARDGAGMIEVGIRLQKTLAALAGADRAAAPIFAEAATHARARADAALSHPPDRELLARLCAGLW
jgi:uncharacterized membrane protein